MASLKVWHFIPNPFDLSDSFATVVYSGTSAGTANIEFTGWGLPDVSIMSNAPTEYIVYLSAGYREDNNSDWNYFSKNIRYNAGMYETQNILMFMPSLTYNNAYRAAHLVGNLMVSTNFTDNKWIIQVDIMAYLPNTPIQYPKDSSVVKADTVAFQGINIYY